MKRFLGFVKKEFIHIFRDLRTMLILFGMPVAQILIFGYVVTNEIKDIKIAILDKSNDQLTRDITDRMISSGYFILDQYISDENEVESIFKKGRVKEIVVFESDFELKLKKQGAANIQLLADASDANTANLIDNYTSGIIMNHVNELNKGKKDVIRIKPQVRMFYNENLKGVYMFVPGTMAMILILISAMMTSISIAREKETGTMEALLVSPLKPTQIVLGKVTPYVLLSFINAVTIVVLGYLVFDVPVQGSVILLLAVSILYIMLALSIGILISTLAKRQQTAMFISMFALMMPTILLSGFIFPIENMPEILQWLSLFMPPRWFIIIIKDIMLKGIGFGFIWKETLVLLTMLIIFIILSVKKFKIRLE
jgi:ABC-2 type transport system permease protein